MPKVLNYLLFHQSALSFLTFFPNSTPKFTFTYGNTYHKNVIMFMCLVTYQTNHGAHSDHSAEWALNEPPLFSSTTTYRD